MIESLSIRNFRCFEHLELHGLKRINVLVGRNSSGKTALLEAIFLASGGNPELALRFRAWRGLGIGVQITPDRKSYESVWEDLFFSLEQKRTISIELVGPPHSTRSVSIAYGERGSLSLPLGAQALDSTAIVPIVFEWHDSKGEATSIPVKLRGNTFELGAAVETARCAFFPTGFLAVPPLENATRFSDLSKKNLERPIVDSIRQEFPYIDDLSLQVNAGATMVYATVHGLSEKIPLGSVSGGVNKLLSLLLAAATYSRGVIVVDEIENGFYHDRLPQLWSNLLRYCKQFDVQIFASTHSQECLKAMAEALRVDESQFCLIRTEKKDGRCGARLFAGRLFESAIEQEVEVR